MAFVSPNTFRLDDFELAVADPSATDTKQVKAGEGWQTLYRRDMGADAQRGIGDHYGRGSTSNPQQAEAFAGLRFVNDSAASTRKQLTGQFRLAVRTPTGELVDVLAEGDLDEYDLFDGAVGSGTELARGDRHTFPNQHPPLAFIGSPYLVTIDVKPTDTVTVDDAESETRAKIEGRQVKRSN